MFESSKYKYPDELNSVALKDALRHAIESSRVDTDPALELGIVRPAHRELFNNEEKSILYTYQIENKTDNDIKLYINKLALNFMLNTQGKINEACANLTGEKLAAFARQFQSNLREAVTQNRQIYESALSTTPNDQHVSSETLTPSQPVQPVTQGYPLVPESNRNVNTENYGNLPPRVSSTLALSEATLIKGLNDVLRDPNLKTENTLVNNIYKNFFSEGLFDSRDGILKKSIESMDQKSMEKHVGKLASFFNQNVKENILAAFKGVDGPEYCRLALLLQKSILAAVENTENKQLFDSLQYGAMPTREPIKNAQPNADNDSPFPKRNEVRRPADNNNANYTQFMPPSGQQNQYQQPPMSPSGQQNQYQQPPKLPTRLTVARNESVRLSSWQTGTSAVSPTILHAQPKYSATQPIYQRPHQSNLRQPNLANLPIETIKKNLETAVSAHNVAYHADHKVEWNIKQNDRNKDQLIIEDTKKNNKEIATVEKIQDNVSYKFSDTITFDAADVILRASQDTEFTLDSENMSDITNILQAANTKPNNEGENKKTITLSEKTLDFLRGQQNVPTIVTEKMEEQLKPPPHRQTF